MVVRPMRFSKSYLILDCQMKKSIKIYNATVEMIASGSDSTEIIFDENYNRRRRIFIEDEVETLKSVPGLLQSFLWGDIEEADFERTLSDLSSFDE